MQDVPKEVGLGNTELAFQKFGIEVILAKSLQYLFDMSGVRSRVARVDQDVVKVYVTSDI